MKVTNLFFVPLLGACRGWLARGLAGSSLALMATLVQAGLPIQSWHTPQGAKVMFVETRGLPILDVQLDFVAGRAYDPPGKAGLAAMTRGLLDAGAGALDEDAIANRLADVGAQLGGGVDHDRASVSLRTLSAESERTVALAILQTVLQQPTFPAAILAREQQRVMAQLREAQTQPGYVASQRLARAMYPQHPYGQDSTPESVATLTRDDVVTFYRQHFTAAQAVVNIVGDVSRAQAEVIASQLVAALPEAAAPAALPVPALPAAGIERVTLPAQQAHILVGMPAIARGDADFFPLLVGNYVLGGGGFVSRLLKEVRDVRGLAYSTYSYFQPRRVAGPFEIGLQTKVSQADAALKVVNDTLARFLAEGPSAAELQAAKANLVNGFVLRLDSNRKVLENLAAMGFYGLPLDYLERWPERVQAVTAEQVRAAFRRHVQPAHLVTVVVGGEQSAAASAGEAR